jgi:hypothetical protein
MRKKSDFDKMKNYLRFDYDRRRDARLVFRENQVPVQCETIEGNFTARLINVSSSGVFIETKKPLQVGKEIAIKFRFPGSEEVVMATGEVIRKDYSGAGVCLKIFFNK